MIHSVEKRRRRVGGSLVFTRNYYLRFRYRGMLSYRWKSLEATDKQVAEKLASEFRREWEREASGILEPKLARDAAKRSLQEHLQDFLGDLQKRGRDGRGGRGAKQLKSRIGRILQETGWSA